MPKATILLIDDEDQLRGLLAQLLELEEYQVLQAATLRQGLQLLERTPKPSLILTDVRLPDGNGLTLLEKVKALKFEGEVIVMTAYGTIQDGVKAIKQGAFDYVVKGDHDEQLLLTVEKAVEKAQLRQRVAELEGQRAGLCSFESIIGHSAAIRQTITMARRVAVTDTVVLLEGETGTGKELFAQSIHQASTRQGKPFVAVNCSAFPKDLLESEMFGYRKGAFSGALADKKGLFEAAHGGTMFLDEIGEMNLDLQAKLLRVLETQTFTKLGDTKQTQVDVRIIAATNRDLLKEAENGHFRPDLYYRLSVFTLNIPALRQRKEDIGELAQFFCRHYAQKVNNRVEGLTADCLERLQVYPWKGNIRELKNVIERAVILADTSHLTVDLLHPDIQHATKPAGEVTSLEEMEKAHIEKVLVAAGGNKSEAARLLGIGISTLYRKMREYGLEE